MSEDRTQALLAEKATIIEELKRHAKADPAIRGMLAAVFEDQGDEIDDNAREVAATEVDMELVRTLSERLEQINQELDSAR